MIKAIEQTLDGDTQVNHLLLDQCVRYTMTSDNTNLTQWQPWPVEKPDRYSANKSEFHMYKRLGSANRTYSL
jgi:hypothetical protein